MDEWKTQKTEAQAIASRINQKLLAELSCKCVYNLETAKCVKCGAQIDLTALMNGLHSDPDLQGKI